MLEAQPQFRSELCDTAATAHFNAAKAAIAFLQGNANLVLKEDRRPEQKMKKTRRVTIHRSGSMAQSVNSNHWHQGACDMTASMDSAHSGASMSYQHKYNNQYVIAPSTYTTYGTDHGQR